MQYIKKKVLRRADNLHNYYQSVLFWHTRKMSYPSKEIFSLGYLQSKFLRSTNSSQNNSKLKMDGILTL